MVYLPTYATKAPSFVGKYTSTMEHMGLISGPVLFWGFSVMSRHDDSEPVFDDGHDVRFDVRFLIQWEETCIETRCLESGIS